MFDCDDLLFDDTIKKDVSFFEYMHVLVHVLSYIYLLIFSEISTSEIIAIAPTNLVLLTVMAIHK